LLEIEYERYFAQSFIPTLIQGEHEWLNNATRTYGSDAGEVWAQDILTRLQEARLEQIDVDDLRSYTPNLLSELLGKQAITFLSPKLQIQLNALPLKR
jgi:hypothetical protein